ncbi:Uncharacterized protein dnm_051030 [Desulfonema magnum]|uniref:Uncharacterized protein n=1 Tax=Desulfonema magnum TaxID=45655 RepID=A0A975GPQ5_9BACT|nr:Uncharacterized protein dnm_051030 [Desulfonema magnum]
MTNQFFPHVTRGIFLFCSKKLISEAYEIARIPIFKSGFAFRTVFFNEHEKNDYCYEKFNF